MGRVMTCVLGMVVRREREIREFVKTPFYRVIGTILSDEGGEPRRHPRSLRLRESGGRWRAPGILRTPCLYKENGFKEKEKAQELIDLSGREDAGR